MTLEDLRAFAHACETENLSEAARRLGCSQPAVAQHVKRLERELGAELLARHARGVVPTAAGRRFYEGVAAALESLDEARRTAKGDRDQAEEFLALAATAMAASGYLRAPILELQKRYPQLRLHIQAANTVNERLDAVRRRQADLALVPLVGPIADLETRRAFQTSLRLLVPRADPLARRRTVTLGQLSDLRYISLGTDTATYRHVERTLRSAGIALETTAVVSDPVMAIFMVELGQGSTFVPAVQAEPAERRGLARALRIEGLPPLDMGWAARRFDRLPQATLRFLEIFERYVRRIGRRSQRSR